MASTQSQAVRDHWRCMTEAVRAHPGQTPQEVRERVEKAWPALTAEPGGVDYLEVEVPAFPALWAVPTGSAEDRVIVSVHGGGGSGSIYTHRKLFGHLAKATGPAPRSPNTIFIGPIPGRSTTPPPPTGGCSAGEPAPGISPLRVTRSAASWPSRPCALASLACPPRPR